MQNETWELIREIHSHSTNIPPHVVDYIAVQDILRLCATGLSNESISKLLLFEQEYIEETVLTFFGMSGWEKDLTFNPLFSYKSTNGVLEVYSELVPSNVHTSFYVCFFYSWIYDEIARYEYDDNNRTS